jgi:hypothetical protein
MLAEESTPPERVISQLVLDLPIQAFDWARRQGLVLIDDLQSPVDSELSEPDLSQEILRLVSPVDNSVYRKASGYMAESQKIRLAAVCETEVQEVAFWMDGSQLATFAGSPFEAWWSLELGAHTFWAEALTLDGETIRSPEVNFEVVGDE